MAKPAENIWGFAFEQREAATFNSDLWRIAQTLAGAAQKMDRELARYK